MTVLCAWIPIRVTDASPCRLQVSLGQPPTRTHSYLTKTRWVLILCVFSFLIIKSIYSYPHGFAFVYIWRWPGLQGFLPNMVQVLLGLAKWPLYLTGKSYAGQFLITTGACTVLAHSHISDPPLTRCIYTLRRQGTELLEFMTCDIDGVCI